jgi:single-strand DNA-binding protein
VSVGVKVAAKPDVDAQARNEVALVGRVSAPAEERTLPSGDVLLTWRLVVDRPPSRRTAPEGARAVTVDTIDCVAWTTGLRRTAGGFEAGDVVRVEGALRRRFWRGGGGPASRYEVEVASTKRLTRARASR